MLENKISYQLRKDQKMDFQFYVEDFNTIENPEHKEKGCDKYALFWYSKKDPLSSAQDTDGGRSKVN
jgi:hypothetical protein